MENIGRAIVDGANIVAKAVSDPTTTMSVPTTTMTSASAASVASAATSMASSAITVIASMTSSVVDLPTDSGNPDGKDNGGGGGGGGSNSPLLFFVALGFGVVFTNLWIIVGVKYCFRYNARNRALARGVDENGEPIDLQNMPARPHRRRREKKLMTMEEVNEKFPMVKYKTWVLDRKKEGLPTTGGISAPPSRANSVRSVNGIIPEQPSESLVSVDQTTTNTSREPDSIVQSDTKPTDKDEQNSIDKTSNVTLAADDDKDATVTNGAPGANPAQAETAPAKDSSRRTSEDDEDDDDDHVHDALDPDMMGSSGDTCAICIDTLEDDDDVRGLTCGHAFHAVCLDPWLTNRRACCPLCKADYYTPKVRPPPVEGETRDPNAPEAPPDPARNNSRLNYPRTPVRSFAWSHFRDAPRQMFPSRFNDTSQNPGQTDRHYQSRQQQGQPRRQSTANAVPQPVLPEENGGNAVTRFRNRFPPFVLDRVMRRNREADAAGANSSPAPAPTPSQLEAGVRPADTRPN